MWESPQRPAVGAGHPLVPPPSGPPLFASIVPHPAGTILPLRIAPPPGAPVQLGHPVPLRPVCLIPPGLTRHPQALVGSVLLSSCRLAPNAPWLARAGLAAWGSLEKLEPQTHLRTR